MRLAKIRKRKKLWTCQQQTIPQEVNISACQKFTESRSMQKELTLNEPSRTNSKLLFTPDTSDSVAAFSPRAVLRGAEFSSGCSFSFCEQRNKKEVADQCESHTFNNEHHHAPHHVHAPRAPGPTCLCFGKRIVSVNFSCATNLHCNN